MHFDSRDVLVVLDIKELPYSLNSFSYFIPYFHLSSMCKKVVINKHWNAFPALKWYWSIKGQHTRPPSTMFVTMTTTQTPWSQTVRQKSPNVFSTGPETKIRTKWRQNDNSRGEKKIVVLSRLSLEKINKGKIKLNTKNTTSLPCVAMNLQWWL